MPTAVRRSRPHVAALVAAAALVAGVSNAGGAKAAESPATTGARTPAVSDFSWGATQPGFVMGDGQTPCDPIRHMGSC